MQIQQFLKRNGIKADKSKGQNFILKKEFLDQFQKSLRWKENCENDVVQLNTAFEKSLVIEIGAGPTGLSRRILKSNPAKLVSVEIDHRFIPLLTDLKFAYPDKFDYHLMDALDQEGMLTKLQEAGLSKESYPIIHLVGNLPFEISGQLLSIWNKQSLSKTGVFGLSNHVHMSLIFSKKMGEKLLPTFNKRTRFSTITQTAFDVYPAGIYPASAFHPMPSCDAIGLKFVNRKQRLFSNEAEVNHYINFLKKIYSLPNKTMGKACSQMPIARQLFDQLGINASDRVFMTPINSLVELARLTYGSMDCSISEKPATDIL